MISGSQPASSPPRSPFKLSDLFGVLIALLTLALPTIVVVSYSGSPAASPATSDRAAVWR